MGNAVLVAVRSGSSLAGRPWAHLPREVEWLEVRANSRSAGLPLHRLRGRFSGRLIHAFESEVHGSRESSEERRRRLLAAARAGFDAIVLEERDLDPEILEAVEPRRRILALQSDSCRPARLWKAIRRLSAIPAFLYRITVRPERAGDEVGALGFLASLGRDDVTLYARGAVGFWTRLAAPRLGAPMVFAWADAEPESDRPSIGQCLSDYGLPQIDEISELYGIVGDPVLQSLSPRLHNAAARRQGRRALFVPFPAHDLDVFLDALQGDALSFMGLGLRGLTVASPLKESALRRASRRSPMSAKAGAANLLALRGRQWAAHTTDPQGALMPLQARGIPVAGRKAAVVGCGGSGRAMAAALSASGARVVLVNRGQRRGRLAERLLGLPYVPLGDFRADGFELLVNATPVGRDNGAIPVDIQGLDEDAAIIDLVYGREPTPLARRARERGLAVIDGWQVLRYQARRQYQLMTGRQMPRGLVRDELATRSRPEALAAAGPGA